MRFKSIMNFSLILPTTSHARSIYLGGETEFGLFVRWLVRSFTSLASSIFIFTFGLSQSQIIFFCRCRRFCFAFLRLYLFFLFILFVHCLYSILHLDLLVEFVGVIVVVGGSDVFATVVAVTAVVVSWQTKLNVNEPNKKVRRQQIDYNFFFFLFSISSSSSFSFFAQFRSTFKRFGYKKQRDKSEMIRLNREQFSFRSFLFST